MNKILILVFAFFCITIQVKSQKLSEAEVTAKMTQAFELTKADKKAEALEMFLIVGENTKQQSNDIERQMYV